MDFELFPQNEEGAFRETKQMEHAGTAERQLKKRKRFAGLISDPEALKTASKSCITHLE